MVDFTFKIENQIITRTDNERIFSGLINEVTATFSFSPEWESVTRYAQFHFGEIGVDVELDVNGKCDVPAEVIAETGQLIVTVWAGNLITASGITILIEESGYTK